MDYIIFIHGVNTRDRQEDPKYADPLITLLTKMNAVKGLTLKMIPLYWGNVNDDLENELLKTYRASQYWEKLSFREIREKQLLQFTGDAALYISRYAGTRVVEALLEEVTRVLRPGTYTPEDRLHLVTHSLGTVILFDVLFSARWEASNAGGYQGVENIRKAIYGLNPDPKDGLSLSSIHTMGSPISVYSLMMSTGDPHFLAIPKTAPQEQKKVPNTHDITPGLLNLLQQLPHKPLPWYNYIHPEDPIAYPLKELLPQMLQDANCPNLDVQTILKVEDVLTSTPIVPLLNAGSAMYTLGSGILNVVLRTCSDFLQLEQLMLRGGNAHGSYWNSKLVAKTIFQTIQDCVTTRRL